jgi:dynein heavy chain
LLQADFDAAMAQKQALEEDAAATERRMGAANALLGALAGEEARWTEQSKAFDDQIQRLTGECASLWHLKYLLSAYTCKIEHLETSVPL